MSRDKKILFSDVCHENTVRKYYVETWISRRTAISDLGNIIGDSFFEARNRKDQDRL